MHKKGGKLRKNGLKTEIFMVVSPVNSVYFNLTSLRKESIVIIPSCSASARRKGIDRNSLEGNRKMAKNVQKR